MVKVQVVRDPNNDWDFSGADSRVSPGIAARVNRATSITKMAKSNTLIKPSSLKNIPGSKPISNNNFKLNF